jgi:hypothetical protein
MASLIPIGPLDLAFVAGSRRPAAHGVVGPLALSAVAMAGLLIAATVVVLRPG